MSLIKTVELPSFALVWTTLQLSADRLGYISCLLIRRISLQALDKNYIGYLELRLKTCNNAKSVIV